MKDYQHDPHDSHTLPPLLKEEVRHFLPPCTDAASLSEQHLDVLRWLIWLPLLTREELACVLRCDEQTLWSHLDVLSTCGLIEYVVVRETNWPLRQHRYYVTDLGLYVLASYHSPELSPHKIALSYPVTCLDLHERLARPQVHFRLSELVTRLIAECPQGYRIASYQQPYRQSYTDGAGKQRTVVFDAAFLLATPSGTQHAFYLLVDQQEHLLRQKEAKRVIERLFALHHAMQVQGEVMPHLLLLSGVERFAFWSEHLEQSVLQHGVVLLNGSLSGAKHLDQGAFAPIWMPVRTLLEQEGHLHTSHLTDVLSLLDRPASHTLIESFSQYFTFQKVLSCKELDVFSRRGSTLERYVDLAFQQEVTPLAKLFSSEHVAPETVQRRRYDRLYASKEIGDTLYGTHEDRLQMSAHLSFALTGQQKDILSLLLRYPYASVPDLLILLSSSEQMQQERPLLRQLQPLLHTNLVRLHHWDEGTSRRDQERYILSESALRHLAVRHGVSPTSYLSAKLPPGVKKRTISPYSRKVTWAQRGAPLLELQMQHTAGLYTCMRNIVAASYLDTTYHVAYWKNAHESVRWHFDRLHGQVAIRPDAELLFTRGDEVFPRSLLIEYDRATTYHREYGRKFRAYADYQRLTHVSLPVVLVITQNERTASLIRQAIEQEEAIHPPYLIVLESVVVQSGLLPLLDHV